MPQLRYGADDRRGHNLCRVGCSLLTADIQDFEANARGASNVHLQFFVRLEHPQQSQELHESNYGHTRQFNEN